MTAPNLEQMSLLAFDVPQLMQEVQRERQLVTRLLAELDRLQDHYSPDEVSDIREVSKTAQRDLVEVAETLKSERDAANATLARIQAVAADVDQDGGHSGPSLARHILNIIGGEA